MSGKSTRTIGFFCFLIAASGARAQDCRQTLSGRILSAGTHEPLPFAQIAIQGIRQKATADEQGHFTISGLCDHQPYTVEISHVTSIKKVETITLNSTTEQQFELSGNTILHEVDVVEKATRQTDVHSSATVDAATLASASGVHLGETLRQLPGVALLSTGATIAKPVIQGLHSNRIAIVNNGVLLQSQQWGSEHAPEIDPFSADQISVVKGASAVRYGAGALGGVVLLEPAPLRTRAGVGGSAMLQGFYNGRGGVFSGILDWKPGTTGPAFRFQATAKRTGNLQTPNYFLYNTGSQELDFNTWSEWRTRRWKHQFQGSVFSQQLGILRSAHIGNTTDLNLAIQSDTPRNNIDQFVYTIDRPRQAVEHYVLKYKGLYRFKDVWTLQSQYNFQFDNRREYDRVRSTGTAADKPQASFRLWSNTVDVSIERAPVRHWQSSAGIQGMQQLNYVGRGGYIPDYWTLGGSAWAMTRRKNFPKPWEFELGARFDYRWNKVTYAAGTYLPPGTDRDNLLHYANVSGTGGIIYHFSKNIKGTIQSGLAWRPPHVYEVFARGIHFATATYEQGNRNLKSEKAWNNQLVLEGAGNRWSFTLNAYRNSIRDFIYLRPLADTFVLTARGAFLGFEYTQDNAVLQGLDGNLTWKVLPQWTIDTRLSLLRGFTHLPDNEGHPQRNWLPLMPGDRYQYGLKWQSPNVSSTDSRHWQNWHFGLNAATVRRQSRIPATGIVAPPPPTYTTLNVDMGVERMLTQNRKCQFGLTVNNLLNTTYRDYLDFFRYFADAPGIQVSIRGRFTF